ncbi:type IV pilus twitching motility protein PilT [Salinibacterium sp. G-O1]|uniref:type IV pilus twitching motility protein PilT n=1 Tax=Salinibacterium sp. G-O1 TaxID=3046208 RepID=UPI0024BB601F|nr:type IV pilus twitching motility protein PilT [Salinibacterium sp. G-O1]MDJ0334124.1 type IV pilus twitching motility protein PilT [Salinibacterium sp. G-O1]
MTREVHEIPISDESSMLRTRVRSESTEGFPPLKQQTAVSAYDLAPPPVQFGAPAPQAPAAGVAAPPAPTYVPSAPLIFPPQPPQPASPAAQAPAQAPAPTPAAVPPAMATPPAPVSAMAPPRVVAPAAQPQAAAAVTPAATTPPVTAPAPTSRRAAVAQDAMTEVLSAVPSVAPAAASPAAAPAAPAPAPEAVTLPLSTAFGGTFLPAIHSSSEPLESDIDPSGDINVGTTEHPEASPQLIDALRAVLRLTASDLHVSSNAPPMLRIDGALQPLPDSTVWSKETVADALMSLLTPAQAATFEEKLELDFAFTVSDKARFRVNYYRQRDTIGGAFRLIPTEIKPLEDLKIPDTVARFAELARGLVLVTGPTGSGKSTTLAALVDLVNRTRTDHIVTVEDPIEFMHGNKRSLINQREVGSDTHSFASALKHVLRQDPDVILIGELRDLETISVALTAAETGHLVFATLHTQSAASTIDRVIDVFPPHQQEQVRAQLASTLQGVVCQTLVKMASGKGRVVATEVMVATPAIANLIREGKTYQIPTALQAGRDLGMLSMDQHLADLVDRGKITHAAAMEKAQDPEGLKRLINRVDSGVSSASTKMAAAAHDFSSSFSVTAN